MCSRRRRIVRFPYDDEEVYEAVEQGQGQGQARRAPAAARTDAAVRSVAAALASCSFPLARHVLVESDCEAIFAALRAFPRAPWEHARRYSAADLRLRFRRGPPPRLGFGADDVPHVLRTTDADYWRVDRLSDFFAEHVRMRARRVGARASPWEAWHGADPAFREAVVRAASARFDRLTPFALREAMWAGAREWPEATLFKPSLALSVLRMLRSRRVLDFSAGWGDRLLAALAHGVERYTGVDPNEALRAPHAAMVRKFGGGGATVVRMLYAPFEDAALEEEDGAPLYDTVFTSPPYFDFETYCTATTQSCARHPTLARWLDGWLEPVLRKAWAHLAPRGHLALHVCDPRLVEPLFAIVGARLRGATYVGALLCTGARRSTPPRPTWVWAKREASAA